MTKSIALVAMITSGCMITGMNNMEAPMPKTPSVIETSSYSDTQTLINQKLLARQLQEKTKEKAEKKRRRKIKKAKRHKRNKKYRVEKFKLTAYCPCYSCSEGYGNMTSTGVRARSSHTIAVDPDVISYGTKVKIGDTMYVAEDCGGAVKGNHIDVYVDSHDETYDFGVKYKKVKIYDK